jgi:DNA (cytosine-5)-methyltransferase 1
MKYFSVCSGVGTDHLAFGPLGWECQGFAEIAPFPSAVLEHRFPGVKNYGDFTKVTKDEVGSVDLLVGGTPCQSFSIAGQRGGLDDPRGNLALEFVRLAVRLEAKWIIWENVPGVLTSGGGRDFGSILRAFRDSGYSLAWRVLDAQWFGVPQRRRRVFLVGCVGGASPVPVLFESPSLRRDTPPSRETREETSRDTGESPTRSSTWWNGNSVASTLDSSLLRKRQTMPDKNRFSAIISYVPDVVGIITTAYGSKNYSNHQEVTSGSVVAYAPFDLAQITSKANYSTVHTGDPVPPLNTVSQMHVAAIHQNNRSEVRLSDTAYALNGGGGKPGQGTPAVLHIRTGQTGANGSNISENLSHTLDSTTSAVSYGTIVRRLTPRECERLQGYPDDWTLVPWRGKQAPDTLRYQAIGNGIALPVLEWIGKRLDASIRQNILEVPQEG